MPWSRNAEGAEKFAFWRHHADRHSVGIGHVNGDEVDAGVAQRQQEDRVGAETLVAEQEREAISARTKAALAAAKARGKKLGTPKPEASPFNDRALASAAGQKGALAQKEKADKFAALVRPVLDELAGLSANKIAQELNRRGVQTDRGGKWGASTVINLKVRLEGLSA